jgi:predicted transposase/invertase (TIGR01784 family)
MKEIPAYFKDKNLDRLFETTMFANMTPELQDRYFREFMYEMDQKSRMRTAREDGIAEGRAETAKAMKAKGYGISEIVEITGLTEKQVTSL